ncbi:MAG TPA: OmpA family protein [Bryobacteraceae bacterium]|nr:OmpA family protein [Bryobacteraceae bacterium]
MALTLSLFAAGCKKKAPPVTPTPPPPPPPAAVVKPAAPVVSAFEVEPSTIERGQAATLRWTVNGEQAEVRIEPGVGTVNASGSRQVFPGNTTTYTLTATNSGGSNSATATVTVNTPTPAPPPPPAKSRRSVSEWLASDVQDALFDYDSSTIREDARAVLSRNAEALKALLAEYRDAVISVEGHADERGSAEYNLGLADRRATAAKEFLVQLGVPADRLKPVSYGKERPQCTESTEACWQQNRRAHFAVGQ